jgi:NADPH:quinone reductase-like Zn-dependent oxidoreductase
MVAGYQKVGRVIARGAEARHVREGDWVFASMSRVHGMFDNRFAGHVSPGVCAMDDAGVGLNYDVHRLAV